MTTQQLNNRDKVVNEDGSPTELLLRVLFDRGNSADDLEAAVAALLARALIAGAGLTGGGDLTANRTFDVGAGTGITVNANDVAIDLTAEAERIRDTIGAALVAGANMTITVNDAGDTITLASTAAGYTDEQAQDAVAAMLTAGTGISVSYNDVANTFTITNTVAAYTDEMAMDAVAAMLTAGTGISVAYNDAANTYTITSSITQYTDEKAMDAIAAMLTAGAGISLSYNDAGDTLTITNTVTQYTDEMARDALGTALVAGTNITITVNDAGDTITINAGGSSTYSHLHIDTVPAANPGGVTTEQVLMTYSLPANTLLNVGDTLEIECLNGWITTGSTKTTRLYFGPTENSGLAAATSNLVTHTKLTVVKTGASAQMCFWESRANAGPVGTAGLINTGNSFAYAKATAETDTAAITIKVTGQVSAAAAGAITCYYLRVKKVNA